LKTSTIVGVLIAVVASVLFIVAFQAFYIKRTFVVYFNGHLDFCLLVDDRYNVSYENSILKYSGGKNSGEITLFKGSLDSMLKRQKFNGFEGGYKKSKNLRHYEYKLNDDYVLVDRFVNAQKSPVNLVPYREECPKIKNNFKVHQEIF
jgi:hypothetical protein